MVPSRARDGIVTPWSHALQTRGFVPTTPNDDARRQA